MSTFFYDAVYGAVPANLFVAYIVFLWVCGWYAKNNALLGLAVAGLAFVLLPLAWLIVFFGLTFTIGIALELILAENVAGNIVIVMDVLFVMWLYIYYAKTAREMRHMHGQHSVTFPKSERGASLPSVRRFTMHR